MTTRAPQTQPNTKKSQRQGPRTHPLRALLTTLILLTAATQTNQTGIFFYYKGKKIWVVQTSDVTTPFQVPFGKFETYQPFHSSFIDMETNIMNRTLYIQTTRKYDANFTFMSQNQSEIATKYSTKIPLGNSSFELDLRCDPRYNITWNNVDLVISLHSKVPSFRQNVQYYINFKKICKKEEVIAYDHSMVILTVVTLLFLYFQARNMEQRRIDDHYLKGLNPFYMAVFFGSIAVAVFMGVCYTTVIEKIIYICFAVGSFCAINLTFSKYLKQCYAEQRLEHKRVFGFVTYMDLICWICAYLLLTGWLQFSDWLSHNIIVFAVLSVVFDVVQLKKFKYVMIVCFIILISNMIKVLHDLSTFGYAPMIPLSNFVHVPSYVMVPRMESFPAGNFVVVNFTDMLALGFILKFLRAFEKDYEQRYHVRQHYSWICLFSYVVAFSVYAVMLTFGISSWPLIFFLVPITSTFVLTFAGYKGDCMKILLFPDREEDLHDLGNGEGEGIRELMRAN